MEEKLKKQADFAEDREFEIYVWALLINYAQPDAGRDFIFDKLQEVSKLGMSADDAIEIGKSIYMNSLKTDDKVLH